MNGVGPEKGTRLSGLKSGSPKLGKSVIATGAVTPTSLAGSKVTLTAQLKKGSKWVKAKAASATIPANCRRIADETAHHGPSRPSTLHHRVQAEPWTVQHLCARCATRKTRT
jgi:hypothetical protein